MLDHPARLNAISLDMWRQLTSTLVEFEQDPTVKCIVIRGAEQRAFSSGADLSEFPKRRMTPEQVAGYDATVGRAIQLIGNSAKPTMAMIHGVCIGGGAAIALACALRFADRQFRFCIPAARLGIEYGDESLRNLVGLIGPSASMDLVLSGRTIDATEGLRLGLVNQVIPRDRLPAHVNDYARNLAKVDSEALSAWQTRIRDAW